MNAQPGEIVAGRYRLNELLGAGAMGEVWRATDELLGREVALKMLRPGYGDDPTFLARFRAEARAVAPLSSPHIAQVFDYGEEPADELAPLRPYLVLEFVPGEPLNAVLERSPQGLGVQRALEVLASTADALQVAHEAGVVHRDIKPANLMVLPSGQIKVTDFGIARVTGAEALTSTGTLLGTAHYLAPEVAGGTRAGPASDVYALGAVAYECLTGTQLYPGEDPVRVAMSHVNEPTPALPAHIPAPVAQLVLACLAKDPAGRPSPARVIAEQARALLAAAASQARGTMAAAVSPAASTVMTPGGSVAGMTGARGEATHDEGSRVEGGGRRRRPDGATAPLAWVLAHPWITLATAAALAVIMVGMVMAMTGGAQPGAAASPTPNPTRPTTTPTPTVKIVADDYIGRQYNDAEQLLRNKGMRVQRKLEPGSGEVGTVTEVDPVGPWPQGWIIELTVVAPEERGGDFEGESPDGEFPEENPDGESPGEEGDGTDSGQQDEENVCEDDKRDKPRGRGRDREC